MKKAMNNIMAEPMSMIQMHSKTNEQVKEPDRKYSSPVKSGYSDSEEK